MEELGAEQGPGSSVGTCARPRAGAQDGPWGPGGDAGSRLVSVSLLAGLCVGQADGGRAGEWFSMDPPDPSPAGTRTFSPPPTPMGFPRAGGWGAPKPETRFLPEVLPKPSLRAWPSSVVPARSSVTLRCGAPTRDVSFTLRKGGRVWEMVQSPDSTEGRAEFHLPDVTSSHAGEYSCEYHGTGDPRGSSGPSDALLLLVTGEGAPGKDGRPGARGRGRERTQRRRAGLPSRVVGRGDGERQGPR